MAKHEASFEQRLVVVCRKYDVMDVVDKWKGGDTVVKAQIVLGDCTEFVTHAALDQDTKPGEVAREIRWISNLFISSIWNARKKFLFPDLVYASGAQIPQRGSAS